MNTWLPFVFVPVFLLVAVGVGALAHWWINR